MDGSEAHQTSMLHMGWPAATAPPRGPYGIVSPVPTRPDWISAQEAADLLHISRPRILQLVKANVLDGAHVGGRLLVHRRSVEIRRRTKDMRRAEIFARPTLSALRERRDAIVPLVALHGA